MGKQFLNDFEEPILTMIAALQVSSFIRIGLVVNVIALPVAYVLLQEWVDNFAYRALLNS